MPVTFDAENMSTRPEIIMNTAEEEAAIQDAASADPDALPLTDDELAEFQPHSH